MYIEVRVQWTDKNTAMWIRKHTGMRYIMGWTYHQNGKTGGARR